MSPMRQVIPSRLGVFFTPPSCRPALQHMSESMPFVFPDLRYARLPSIRPAAMVAALLCGPSVALATNFVEPPVFASSHGVLDLLIVVLPQPVPSISYVPPSGRRSSIRPAGSIKSARERRPFRSTSARPARPPLLLRRHSAGAAEGRSTEVSPGEQASADRSGDAGEHFGRGQSAEEPDQHPHPRHGRSGAGADTQRPDLR